MIWFRNSKIYLDSGILQNCSAQNFKIFTIYNSSFYLGNTQFHDFHSQLIYSGLGILKIDSCYFENMNYILESDSAINLEKQVSFILKKCKFQYLNNFDNVLNHFL